MTAFIPYGAYRTTPFARWQGGLAHLHSIELAAHVIGRFLSERGLDGTDMHASNAAGAREELARDPQIGGKRHASAAADCRFDF